jgi:signal transduction histidine kinase
VIRVRGLLWPALAAFALALTFVALQSAGPATGRHERTLAELRTLTLGDAALQRDVLRARAGLLTSYDPIVADVAELRHAARALRDATGDADDAALERKVADVAAAVDRQERDVETFKSQYALLRNSLAYLGHRSGTTPGPAMDALASGMFRLTSGGGAEAAAAVTSALAVSRPGDPLTAHGRLLVEILPEVDRFVGAILAAPIAGRVQAVQEAYIADYASAAAQADRYRLVLYAAALALVGYLGRLFLRLRATAHDLATRVALEKLVSEISAAFIDLPGEALGAGVESGLARLGQAIAADRATFVAGDPAGQAFAWSRTASGPPPLAPAAILDLAAGGHSDGRARVVETAALPDGPERVRLRGSGIATWLGVATQLGSTERAVLAFDTFRRRAWAEDDLALLRTAAEIFANAIGRQRGEADRAALQERLAHAHRLEAIGTLAGGIAHEFNNVLGVIVAAAEMALPAAGPVRRRVEQIAIAAERGKHVVDQVLAFSRRRERELRALRVEPVVAEAIQLLRTSLPATVTLEARLAAGAAAVRGDVAEVQQVVMNLCSNAVHAMDGRGTLDIGLDKVTVARDRGVTQGVLPAGDYVRLAVRDSGHGMDAATLRRVFEPFFTTKSAGAGTGLGLATVHGYVTRHGGVLDVTSEVGRGSRFEVYWPRVEAPSETADGPAGRVARGDGEAVLIVDDEPDLVSLGEEMLATLGYEPVGYASAEAALAAFRADPGRFDLALLDEVMPGMTGSELASVLAAERPDLPVVLMTGYPGAIPTARRSAIREVLAKPLRSATLAECLAGISRGDRPPLLRL